MSLTVKQWRLAKQMTVAEMAAACGVHPNTYARWEDEPGKISIEAAVKIAEALGESIDDIFFAANSTKCRA